MVLTWKMDEWLRQAGYEYHCFISWPHTANQEITNCARKLKQQIESRLGAYVSPRVFLDESILTPGDDWPTTIQHALCRSLTMVAICAPIYYAPDHKWCGLEWATMQRLSNARLRGQNYGAIIPVMIRKTEPLPPVVSRIQHTDFSGMTTQSYNYFRTNEFRDKAEQIVAKIQRVAQAIQRNRAKANCDKFVYPKVSAFDRYVPASRSFPFH